MVGPIQGFSSTPPQGPVETPVFSAPPADLRANVTQPRPEPPEPKASPVLAELELREKFDEHLESLSGLLEGLGSRLDFDVVDGSNQLLVRIVDRDSGEVLRQVPAPEVLELRRRLETGLGGFVDESV